MVAAAVLIVAMASSVADARPGHPILTRLGHGLSNGLHGLGRGLHNATHGGHSHHHRHH
jgi:hypothetical protein